jgi:hypothetical protein
MVINMTAIKWSINDRLMTYLKTGGYDMVIWFSYMVYFVNDRLMTY